MNEELDLRNLPEPPQEAYAAVRRRVLTSIRREKRIRMALRAVVAAAACVLLVCGGWLALHRPAPVPPVPLLARTPVPPPGAYERPHLRTALVRHKRVRPRREMPLLAKVHREPLVVKMQTDDPNVIILWLVD